MLLDHIHSSSFETRYYYSWREPLEIGFIRRFLEDGYQPVRFNPRDMSSLQQVRPLIIATEATYVVSYFTEASAAAFDVPLLPRLVISWSIADEVEFHIFTLRVRFSVTIMEIG